MLTPAKKADDYIEKILKMKNVIILGASGNISKLVTGILVKKDDTNLTLFVRNKNRLSNDDVSKCRIIEGSVMQYNQLKEAIKSQDIVFAGLSGDWKAWQRIL